MQDAVVEQGGGFYRPDTGRDEPAILALTEAAERYSRYEFKKLFYVLWGQAPFK